MLVRHFNFNVQGLFSSGIAPLLQDETTKIADTDMKNLK